MSFTQVTLTGTVQASPGNAVANALVTATLSAAISDGTTIIEPATVSVRTDASGALPTSGTTLTVPANDDSTTTPTGTYYTITVSGPGVSDTWEVVVPHAAATVDLFSLARLGTRPTAASPFVATIQGLNGTVGVTSPGGTLTVGTSGSDLTLEVTADTFDAYGAASAAEAAAEAASVPRPASPSAGDVPTWTGSAWDGLPPEWVYFAGKPAVTVSPIGLATSGVTVANNGADYGPDTPNTTTSGIQEALTALEPTGGKITLLQGAFAIGSAMTYTSDFSLTIEGETRGREENQTTSTDAFGVFLLVDSLASGVFPLTIGANSVNLGMVRLANFTMRGAALGYEGSTYGAMRGISLSGANASPAQVEIDNVAFEYLTSPLEISNGVNGPIIATWIGFFFCTGSVDGALWTLTTGTCHIGHIEAFATYAPVLGITGTASNFSYIDIDSFYVDSGRAINFGCLGPAPTTYLHIGSLSDRGVGASGLIRLEASAGSLYCQIDRLVSEGGSQDGYLLEGTGQSTSGQVQVSVKSFYGNLSQWVNNAYGATVGAGSYVDVRGATLSAAPAADAKYADMTVFVQEVGTSEMQQTLAGTTAGSAVSAFDEYTATDKRFKVYLNGYENTTATAQTITYPYPFTNVPAVVHDDSGGALAAATEIALPASMSAAKTGWIIVEGY